MVEVLLRALQVMQSALHSSHVEEGRGQALALLTYGDVSAIMECKLNENSECGRVYRISLV